jgi:RNA polymerase sigma factor (sigma-70 family)
MQALTFEQLCQDYYARVARLVYLIVGDQHEAEDLSQETFARAYERWRHVSDMDSPAAWLYRVAVNLAISHQRRYNRRPRATRLDVTTAPPEVADPELAAALRAISPSQRAAVVCRFYLDMSIEEAAAVLDKKPGTIRALTSQGTSRLRAILGADFMEVRDE